MATSRSRSPEHIATRGRKSCTSQSSAVDFASQAEDPSSQAEALLACTAGSLYGPKLVPRPPRLFQERTPAAMPLWHETLFSEESSPISSRGLLSRAVLASSGCPCVPKDAAEAACALVHHVDGNAASSQLACYEPGQLCHPCLPATHNVNLCPIASFSSNAM